MLFGGVGTGPPGLPIGLTTDFRWVGPKNDSKSIVLDEEIWKGCEEAKLRGGGGGGRYRLDEPNCCEGNGGGGGSGWLFDTESGGGGGK